MCVAPNPSNQNNFTYTFLATGVERISEQQTEASEDIQVHLMSAAEVRELLENEQIIQCLNVAPLWRYFAENPIER
jgi:ADP-ribose pyrophosphatase